MPVGRIGADLAGERDFGSIENEAAIVFDVDYQRVHFGFPGDFNQRLQLAAQRCPTVDVETAQGVRSRNVDNWLDRISSHNRR